jgi:1-deoxy-D-xylulose-5-phosphate synthase
MINKLKNISIEKLKLMNTHEIETVSDNIREFLIDSNSKTGGHIGANLGTVELSLALHYVFNSPNDSIIWDTGHTGYTHKILTGRADNFSTLNTYGGMNRFISSSESEHDFIEASHAGTSISVALGRALSLRNSGKNHWSIAVIGDGALAEGIALEALNHASVEKNIRLMIVLNDNGYAISPGFGAIHEYLQSRQVDNVKPDTLFTSLGYKVIGPIDGHSSADLISVFNNVIESNQICLVHIKTEKGHGLAPATNHDFKMHYSFPFDPITGKPTINLPTLGYQDIASMAIEDCMMKNPDIVAITPSTLYATGLSKVFETFPERCFDPGMEEQHAASMAVGMALSGSRPVLFYQSTFLQRAFDQIIHDICFSNQNILILSVRSGFSGYDNPTHHGIYDFSYLRGVPNLKTYYPKDSHELYEMVFQSLIKPSGPVLIHMPYGPADDSEFIRNKVTIDMESPEEICKGSDGVIISVGNKVKECKLAINNLSKKGLSFGLVNVRKLKPLPENQLIKIIGDLKKVVTVEESVLEGGFGSAVSSMLHQHRMKNELFQIGLPCSFIEAGSNEELSSIYGVDSKGIERQILEYWSEISE